ncbi:hypothetical protein [Rhodococcus opacus]|uniref:hypothetical protein n=1 Tax=Rhodococcus opacus TaxID=37919 RepID=UPI0005C1FD3A|nr:hypothetical protein [Rhodococcus opacus]
MFVRLCDTRVTVQSGDADPLPLTGQAALFLRLLLLWDDGLVTADLAAHVLDVRSSHIGTYVGNLRDALGDREAKARLETIAGNSRSIPRQPTTYKVSLTADFPEFRTLTDQALEIAGEMWTDHRDLTDSAVAAAVPLLDKALGMWRGSPATGLDHAGSRNCNPKKLKVADLRDLDGHRERLVDIFDEWKKRHADAVLLRADCTLFSDDGKAASNEVLERVSRLAKIAPPDDRIWYRLLFAADRAGDRKRHEDFWARAEKHFAKDGEEMPPEVEQLKPHRGRQNLDRGKAATQPGTPESRSGIDALVPIVEALGIGAPSAHALGEVSLSPIECTKRAENALDFAGVLAGKWVGTREVHDSFVAMLQKFQRRNPRGRARFLVIDPSSEAYDRLVQIRGGEVSPSSVEVLLRLREKYPCLEVRGTKHLPAFRVLVIDDDIVSVSPYDLENQSAQSSRLGWQAPHMLLDPLAPFPLAPAFRLYFDSEWDAANPLPTRSRTSG